MSDCLRLSHPPLAHLNQRSPTTARQTKPQKRVPNDVCQASQASGTKVRDIWNDHFKRETIFWAIFWTFETYQRYQNENCELCTFNWNFLKQGLCMKLGFILWQKEVMTRQNSIGSTKFCQDGFQYIQLKQQNILSKDQKSSCLFNYHHCTG